MSWRDKRGSWEALSVDERREAVGDAGDVGEGREGSGVGKHYVSEIVTMIGMLARRQRVEGRVVFW